MNAPKKNDPVAKLKAELKIAEEARVRALADLENFRRRESENRAQWGNLAVADFLRPMLKKFLELKLAAEHTQDKDMQSVVAAFFAELTKTGLSEISPVTGEAVDPHRHDVLMAEEGDSPGTVVRTLEPGWQYGDVVLTPAKVSATPSN